MACDIKIRINTGVDDDGKQQFMDYTIAEQVEGVNADSFVPLEDVAAWVSEWDRDKRQQFASELSSSLATKLTPEMVKNCTLVSNITFGQLTTKYPDLKKALNLDSEHFDKYNLIYAPEFKINGHNYVGRVIDATGKEFFIIKGPYSALNFVRFVQAKEQARTVFEEKSRKIPELEEYMEDLAAIASSRKMSMADTVEDFLTHKSVYESDITVKGKPIRRYFVMINVAAILADDYDSFNTRYTAFETALHNLNTNHTKKKGNTSSNFDWVIHMGKLYGTIVDFNPEFGEKYTKEDFLKLDADGLSAVLKESGVLRWNPKLECATVTEIQKNETKNKEGETVVTPYVRFSFPFMTIGKLFNFGYDSTESLFAPVNEGPVTDGMYKGMYIYKYVQDGKQLYAISRSIISPNSYMSLFKNLNEAIRGVDGHVKEDVIDKNSLISFKQEGEGAVPRKVMLELEHAREGQVVSVLDIDVPNIRFYNLPASIRSLFSLNVEQFKNLFRDKDGKLMIPAMENLYTPEQVATLLYLLEGNNDILDNNDRFSVKGYGVNTMATVQIYVKNAKKVEGAINKILSAGKRHFYIERTVPSKQPVGTLAWVKYLNHGGTDVSTTGLSIGEITTDTFIKLTLTQAIEHFRDTYGVQVHAMDSEGLKEFSKTNGLGFEDKVSSVRAFIYNGEVYINTSVAHMSDLYHEIAHLYLGVLKVLHPDAYRQLMDYYRVKPEKTEGKQTDEQKARQAAFNSFENKLENIKDFYQGMARADLEEEAVAAMIGDSLMSDNRLALDGLDDARYQELMDNVARTVGLFTESENDNGLGFTKIMSELKSNTDRVKRRRQVSNYIKEQIANENITEIC